MQAQIFVFLAAGYETTATTLGYMSHYLALFPEVQTKLQDEIDEAFQDPVWTFLFMWFFSTGTAFVSVSVILFGHSLFCLQRKQINYETVQGLEYLDMVFCETSRLASIGGV